MAAHTSMLHVRVDDDVKEQAVLNIRTFYERMWLSEGKRIHYCRFAIR